MTNTTNTRKSVRAFEPIHTITCDRADRREVHTEHITAGYKGICGGYGSVGK